MFSNFTVSTYFTGRVHRPNSQQFVTYFPFSKRFGSISNAVSFLLGDDVHLSISRVIELRIDF